MNTRQGRSGMWWLLLLVALGPLVVCTVLLGPARAGRIAAASFLSTAVDPMVERSGPHRIPVMDVHVAPAHLDSLGADLLGSRGRYVPAELRYNGIAHGARFGFDAQGMDTLGGSTERSFQLSIHTPTENLPFHGVYVRPPKAMNMLSNHMGLWIGGLMGVAVPHDELVFVRLNGRDHGVMELCEQPDARFEQVRGAHHGPVAVFKGDHAPLQGRSTGAMRSLWADATLWEQVGTADSARAREQLGALVAALTSDSITLDERRAALERTIDVGAWLRYIAAMQVVNTAHSDKDHNRVIVLCPRTARFYPVLWDPLLMHAQPGEPSHYVHDALSYWLLRMPEWRLAKDRHVYAALQRLHHQGLFAKHWRSLEDRLLPSLLADRNKACQVTHVPGDVHRFSIVHAAVSGNRMRSAIAAYWDRLNAQLSANDVTVHPTEDGLNIRAASEAPLRLSWPARIGPLVVLRDDETLPVERQGDRLMVTLHRAVEHVGAADHAFAPRGAYRVLPLDAFIRFPQGLPEGLMITNAITDAEVR